MIYKFLMDLKIMVLGSKLKPININSRSRVILDDPNDCYAQIVLQYRVKVIGVYWWVTVNEEFQQYVAHPIQEPSVSQMVAAMKKEGQMFKRRKIKARRIKLDAAKAATF